MISEKEQLNGHKLRIPDKQSANGEFVLRSVRVRKEPYEKLRAIAKRTGRSITEILQIAIDNIE